jgi:hypothetical protein
MGISYDQNFIDLTNMNKDVMVKNESLNIINLIPEGNIRKEIKMDNSISSDINKEDVERRKDNLVFVADNKIEERQDYIKFLFCSKSSESDITIISIRYTTVISASSGIFAKESGP